MTLSVKRSSPLKIPGELFNNDGIAVIHLSGGRYGGEWVVAVSYAAAGPLLGKYETGKSSDPDTVIEAGFRWLASEVKRHGWRLVGFTNMNDLYKPDEAPYFCLAQAMIANESFVPAPGFTYADEQA